MRPETARFFALRIARQKAADFKAGRLQRPRFQAPMRLERERTNPEYYSGVDVPPGYGLDEGWEP